MKLFAVSLLTLLVLGFQNCSKVSFDASEGSSLTKTEGSSELPELPPENPEQIPPINPETPEGRREIEHLKGQCRLGQLLPLPTLADGTVISGRGNVIARIGTNVTVDDFRGNLILFGKADTTAIKLAKNYRGNFILCGGNVEAIDDGRGNTIIVHGDVGDINNYRGNLIVLDGNITGNITDIRGNVHAFNFNSHAQ